MDRSSSVSLGSFAAVTLVGAALLAGPAAAQSAAGSGSQGYPTRALMRSSEVPSVRPDLRGLSAVDAGCVAEAQFLARRLVWSAGSSSVSEVRVSRVIARIKSVSGPCNDLLFHDGSKAHPNAGFLVGNGFSYAVGNCPGTTQCNGGNAGSLRGDGGDGRNGGQARHLP